MNKLLIKIALYTILSNFIIVNSAIAFTTNTSPNIESIKNNFENCGSRLNTSSDHDPQFHSTEYTINSKFVDVDVLVMFTHSSSSGYSGSAGGYLFKNVFPNEKPFFSLDRTTPYTVKYLCKDNNPSPTSDADRLLDWAQPKYPELFYPENNETFEVEGYTARHYVGSNTYIGIKEGKVYIYGDQFGGLKEVGGVQEYLKTVDKENLFHYTVTIPYTIVRTTNPQNLPDYGSQCTYAETGVRTIVFEWDGLMNASAHLFINSFTDTKCLAFGEAKWVTDMVLPVSRNGNRLNYSVDSGPTGGADYINATILGNNTITGTYHFDATVWSDGYVEKGYTASF